MRYLRLSIFSLDFEEKRDVDARIMKKQKSVWIKLAKLFDAIF
jgi:hypothetical protein